MSRKQLILVAVAVIIALVVLGIFSLRTNHQNSLPPQQAEGDIQKSAPIVIENTESLANLLLAQQFLDVKSALVSHLHAAYPNANKATIINTPAVAQDGSISFQLQLASYTAPIDVIISRLPHGEIEIVIPQDKYTNTIDVYESSPED